MRFISGRLKLDVKFNDRTDEYKVRVCPTVKGESCETVNVGLPGAGPRSQHGRRLAVDDPRAMASAARAAISFAREGTSDYAEYNRRGTHAIVRPPKRKRRR